MKTGLQVHPLGTDLADNSFDSVQGRKL